MKNDVAAVNARSLTKKKNSGHSRRDVSIPVRNSNQLSMKPLMLGADIFHIHLSRT